MSDPLSPDPTLDQAACEDGLETGLAAAFGPESGPALPASGSVLKALGADVPHVQLREPDSGGASPVVRPRSEEMPQPHDSSSRIQLHGEIARGGMGAI